MSGSESWQVPDGDVTQVQSINVRQWCWLQLLIWIYTSHGDCNSWRHCRDLCSYVLFYSSCASCQSRVSWCSFRFISSLIMTSSGSRISANALIEWNTTHGFIVMRRCWHYMQFLKYRFRCMITHISNCNGKTLEVTEKKACDRESFPYNIGCRWDGTAPLSYLKSSVLYRERPTCAPTKAPSFRYYQLAFSLHLHEYLSGTGTTCIDVV